MGVEGGSGGGWDGGSGGGWDGGSSWGNVGAKRQPMLLTPSRSGAGGDVWGKGQPGLLVARRRKGKHKRNEIKRDQI